MNKREEIREGIIDTIYTKITPISGIGGIKLVHSIREMSDEILTYLDSQGVVIKRDSELPESFGCHWVRIEDETFTEVIMDSKKALEKAGYTLTERLIDA